MILYRMHFAKKFSTLTFSFTFEKNQGRVGLLVTGVSRRSHKHGLAQVVL